MKLRILAFPLLCIASITQVIAGVQCSLEAPVYVVAAEGDLAASAKQAVVRISDRVQGMPVADRKAEIARIIGVLEQSAKDDSSSDGECNAQRSMIAATAKEIDKRYGTSVGKKYVVATAEQIAAKKTEFRKSLKAGTRVMACSTEKVLMVGTVIEIKKPMAYVQWENKYASDRVSWAPIGELFLATRGPSDRNVTDEQVGQEAMRRTGGNAERTLRRLATEPGFKEAVYADLKADDECK